jgi:hypothetical protein
MSINFLGFVNFYRLFIQDYSKTTALLTSLTYKDKLEWISEADQAFQDPKTAFTMAPILIHPDFLKPFFLESDTSDYALRAVYLKKETTNDFTQLYFIHGNLQLLRSIMRFMINNF